VAAAVVTAAAAASGSPGGVQQHELDGLTGSGGSADPVAAFAALRRQLDAETAAMAERAATLLPYAAASDEVCAAGGCNDDGSTGAILPSSDHVAAAVEGTLSERRACLRPVDRTQWRDKFNSRLLELELEPGRACPEPLCADRCGLHVWEHFLTDVEVAELVAHGEAVLSEAAARKARKQPTAAQPPAETKKQMVDLSRSALYGSRKDHLLFIRVLERIRRAAATTFKLPLSQLRFASHFLSKITASRDVKESSWHCDESSYGTFHFSAVLWLSTEGVDFGGGEVAFRGASGNQTISVSPRSGRVAFFSSGWENIHRVAPVTNGVRWSVPVFLEVLPDPELTRATRFAKQCANPTSSQAYDRCLEQWHQLLEA